MRCMIIFICYFYLNLEQGVLPEDLFQPDEWSNAEFYEEMAVNNDEISDNYQDYNQENNGEDNSIGSTIEPAHNASNLRFLRGLTNVTKNSGEIIKYRCEIAGQPLPNRIRWFKNDAPILVKKFNNRINIKHFNHQTKSTLESKLRISHLDIHDTGFYTCSTGTTLQSTGVLIVKPIFSYTNNNMKSSELPSNDNSNHHTSHVLKSYNRWKRKFSRRSSDMSNINENNMKLTAEDLTQDEPSENYWKVLAERRRIELEEALKENQKLHEKMNLLNEENSTLQNLLNETTELVELLNTIVKEGKKEGKLTWLKLEDDDVDEEKVSDKNEESDTKEELGKHENTDKNDEDKETLSD